MSWAVHADSRATTANRTVEVRSEAVVANCKSSEEQLYPEIGLSCRSFAVFVRTFASVAESD
jgi:hypothetical protein